MKHRLLEQLTAFLDGELPKNERKAVLKLLHRSSKARAVLKELQENIHAMKKLSRHRLGPDFTAKVLAAHQQRQTAPAVVSRFAWLRQAPARWAVAAGIVVAAGGLLAYSLRSNDVLPPTGEALFAHLLEGTVSFAKNSGAHFLFHDLHQDQQQQRLAQEIGKDPQRGVHLDVTVKNDAQAVDRLRNALQEKGISLIVDPSAQAQTDDAPVEYLVFAENILPHELNAMLKDLGSDPKKLPSDTFDSVLVNSMTTDDRKMLSGLFGVEAEKLKPKMSPLQVAKSLDPEPRKPAPAVAPKNKVAVIVANTPGKKTPPPAALQSYLDDRPLAAPGTLQVMIVVHGNKKK